MSARKTASKAELGQRAAAIGWELQEGPNGLYRMVDAKTETWVAASWQLADGFGLTLAAIEDALDSANPRNLTPPRPAALPAPPEPPAETSAVFDPEEDGPFELTDAASAATTLTKRAPRTR